MSMLRAAARANLNMAPSRSFGPGFPSVCVVPQDSVHDKNLSNLQEIRARGGKVIAITTEGDKEIGEFAEDVIYIPKTPEMLTPILAAIPLQLFAYESAALFAGTISTSQGTWQRA